MNTTENQHDPYAHLKQAWESGRRIRLVGGIFWREKGKNDPYEWNYQPGAYEIEPIPADKWAAEKAAHAQGKMIETRWMHDGDWTHWVTCKRHPSTWHSEYTSQEYRIAPDPAPAGKLSDEQLGEIGAKAASFVINRPERVDYFSMVVTSRSAFWDRDAPARTAFARAVREAVEKERAEEIARLTAELYTVKAERAETRVIRSEMIKAQAELAKANAELERLRWRSTKERADLDDSDRLGNVEAIHKNGNIEIWNVNAGFPVWLTHWRPCCPPPAPTAEEVERERFEKWATKEGYNLHRQQSGAYSFDHAVVAWEAWNAARAAKEGEK